MYRHSIMINNQGRHKEVVTTPAFQSSVFLVLSYTKSRIKVMIIIIFYIW